MEPTSNDVASSQQSPANASLNANSAKSGAALWLALIGGLLGGVIGFLVVNAAHPVLAFEDLPELGMSASAELVARYHAAEYAFRSGNGAVDCGILGGCVGLVIGLFTVRRRALGAIVTGIIGLAFGALAGFIIGRFVATSLITSAPQTLAQSAFYHGTIWGLIGGGIGGCVGLLNRSPASVNLTIFGLIGGLLGAIVFNIVAPIVAPASNLSIVTPASAAERIVWIGSSAICIGLFIGLALRDSQTQRSQKTSEV